MSPGCCPVPMVQPLKAERPHLVSPFSCLTMHPTQFSATSLTISWVLNLLCNHQNMFLNNSSAFNVINYFLLWKLLFGFPRHYSLLVASLLPDHSFLSMSSFPTVTLFLAQGYIPGSPPFSCCNMCCSISFEHHTHVNTHERKFLAYNSVLNASIFFVMWSTHLYSNTKKLKQANKQKNRTPQIFLKFF